MKLDVLQSFVLVLQILDQLENAPEAARLTARVIEHKKWIAKRNFLTGAHLVRAQASRREVMEAQKRLEKILKRRLKAQ